MLSINESVLTDIATNFANRASTEASRMNDCLKALHTADDSKREELNIEMERASIVADACVAFGALCCFLRDNKTVEELYASAEDFFKKEVSRKD